MPLLPRAALMQFLGRVFIADELAPWVFQHLHDLRGRLPTHAPIDALAMAVVDLAGNRDLIDAPFVDALRQNFPRHAAVVASARRLQRAERSPHIPRPPCRFCGRRLHGHGTRQRQPCGETPVDLWRYHCPSCGGVPSIEQATRSSLLELSNSGTKHQRRGRRAGAGDIGTVAPPHRCDHCVRSRPGDEQNPLCMAAAEIAPRVG